MTLIRPLPTTTTTRTTQATITRTQTQVIVDAGNGDDRIHISKRNSNLYVVDINGAPHYFNRADALKLNVLGGAGNDRITLDSSLDLPIRVNGGSGHDTIVNHARGARLSGGSGHDTIINRAANATISGGSGNDRITNTGRAARIHGGSGADRVVNHASFSVIQGGSGNDSIMSYGAHNRAFGGAGFDTINNQGRDAFTSYGSPRPSFNAGIAGPTSDYRGAEFFAAQANAALADGRYGYLMQRADAALGQYSTRFPHGFGGLSPQTQSLLGPFAGLPGYGPGSGYPTANDGFGQAPKASGGAAFGAPNAGLQSMLADPSLTVEDKVALTLMMVAQQMDKEIEKQTNRIQALQTGGNAQGNSSIDVETMKLNRLVTKRAQLFDALRSIIDKYNETAKNTIQSMGR